MINLLKVHLKHFDIQVYHPEPITKVLRSAVANAENNLGLDPSSLVITTATADMGPPMKRYRPRAQGRAFAIKKQTCHISIAVSANQSTNSEDSD